MVLSANQCWTKHSGHNTEGGCEVLLLSECVLLMLGYHIVFFIRLLVEILFLSLFHHFLSSTLSPSPLLSFISSVSSPLLSLIPLQIKDVTSLSRRSFRFFRSINHVNRVYNAVNDLVDENKPTRLDDVLISSVSIFEDILLVSKLDFVLFYFVTFYIID